MLCFSTNFSYFYHKMMFFLLIVNYVLHNLFWLCVSIMLTVLCFDRLFQNCQLISLSFCCVQSLPCIINTVYVLINISDFHQNKVLVLFDLFRCPPFNQSSLSVLEIDILVAYTLLKWLNKMRKKAYQVLQV